MRDSLDDLEPEPSLAELAPELFERSTDPAPAPEPGPPPASKSGPDPAPASASASEAAPRPPRPRPDPRRAGPARVARAFAGLPAGVVVVALVVVVAVGAGLVAVARSGSQPGTSSASSASGDSSESARQALPAAPAARAEPLADEVHVVAEAVVESVPVFATPDAGAEPERTLAHPTEVGTPLVFLVEHDRGEWLNVHLPVRPNGTTGWVRAADVRLSQHTFRIVVDLGEHRLALLERGAVRFETSVGVGTSDTPTPGGVFYIKELLKPPDPDTIYGNYAFGLSGFSNAIESFAGGEGVIGIHGTNDPSSVGRDVSHGCIRLTNEAMLALVGTVPLGTPVEIRA